MVFLVDFGDSGNMPRRRHGVRAEVVVGGGHRPTQRHNLLVAEHSLTLKVRHVLLRLVVVAEVRTVTAAAAASASAKPHAAVLILLRAQNLFYQITADIRRQNAITIGNVIIL